jgi:hypothetical protein
LKEFPGFLILASLWCKYWRTRWRSLKRSVNLEVEKIATRLRFAQARVGFESLDKLVALGAIALLALFEIFSAAQQKPQLKVFISVDMEGILGVVHGDQTTLGTAEYAAGRKWMAQDVVTVAVKEAYGRLAAKLVPMGEARRMIRAGVKDALGKLGRVKPFKIAPPYNSSSGTTSRLRPI